jgi:hypothetical protein
MRLLNEWYEGLLSDDEQRKLQAQIWILLVINIQIAVEYGCAFSFSGRSPLLGLWQVHYV